MYSIGSVASTRWMECGVPGIIHEPPSAPRVRSLVPAPGDAGLKDPSVVHHNCSDLTRPWNDGAIHRDSRDCAMKLRRKRKRSKIGVQRPKLKMASRILPRLELWRLWLSLQGQVGDHKISPLIDTSTVRARTPSPSLSSGLPQTHQVMNQLVRPSLELTFNLLIHCCTFVPTKPWPCYTKSRTTC
jgi:hypothetical protein